MFKIKVQNNCRNQLDSLRLRMALRAPLNVFSALQIKADWLIDPTVSNRDSRRMNQTDVEQTNLIISRAIMQSKALPDCQLGVGVAVLHWDKDRLRCLLAIVLLWWCCCRSLRQRLGWISSATRTSRGWLLLLFFWFCSYSGRCRGGTVKVSVDRMLRLEQTSWQRRDLWKDWKR